MPSMRRGQIVKAGGMADAAQGHSRPDPGNPTQVRPAYRITAGQMQPTQPFVGGAHGALLDLSSVSGWRLVFVAAAAAYVIGFHVTLGRARVGVGPR